MNYNSSKSIQVFYLNAPSMLQWEFKLKIANLYVLEQ